MKRLFLGALALFVVFAMLGCQQDAGTEVIIRFNLDYEDAPAAPGSVNVKIGEPVGNKLPVPSRAGYDFTGWLFYSDGGWVPVTGATVFSAGTTLYAGWRGQIFVTFHMNYLRSSSMQTRVEHVSGVPIGDKIPNDPRRENFTFLGWFRDSQGNGERITAGDTFTGDSIVYASWRDDRKVITISFDVNFPSGGGPDTPESFTIRSGEMIKENIPAMANMVNNTLFHGWFQEKTGGVRVERTTVFTNDATLYARWTTPTGTITLNLAKYRDMTEDTDSPWDPTPPYTLNPDGSLTATLGDFPGQGFVIDLEPDAKARMDALKERDQILVIIDGTVSSEETMFRMYLGNPISGANWNATETGNMPVVFSEIKDKFLTFGGNKNDYTTECFVLQWRSDGDPDPVTVTIKSIKIYY